ncbi:uncharacterized protein OCT59_000313 [Rhizophagus irregularis]|uniref:uncharacterized protein n=1 Tax=Rhizophagus irregularis TaxID=588596 RepID=UPI003331FF1F|nr:hypothetical protein OCT59_000313 [Rhizophagus irregularis]
MDSKCNEHKISKAKIPQSIQECCKICLRILSFKQIEGCLDNLNYLDKNSLNILYNRLKRCQLCGESLDEHIREQFILCTNCFLISFEWIESTLVKKQILILYLPWWHDNSNCNLCHSELTFTSDCQKYCEDCHISYVGCRYCLTTNIIFGLTGQTQCKKCKRISLIICSNVDRDLVVYLLNDIIYDNYIAFFYIRNIVNTEDKYFKPKALLYSIFEKIFVKNVKNVNKKIVEWIPYSQFKNIKEITKGGYGIIYKATWSGYNEEVILKRFENSKNDIKYFINELKSNQHCKNGFNGYIIEVYGFTKDPELGDYLLVMEYAPKGDLHKYLQKNFTNITWNNQKLQILLQISQGKYKEEFIQAEEKRNKLIKSKNIGPEFAEKNHPEAIYTSRPLSAFISKCLSTNISSTISFGNNQDYDYNYISKEKELDIEIESLSSQNLTIQNPSTSLKKRNNEELNLETYDNSVEKRIKSS